MNKTLKVDDIVLRKNRKCKIVHIDYSTEPVSLTVLMLDTNTEVGTEFSRIKQIPIIKKKPKRRNKKRKSRGGLVGYFLK